VFLVVALLSTTVILAFMDWRVWAWSVPIALYRGINILRIYHGRLPRNQLRTVSLRAFGWLLAGQIIITTLAGLARHYHFGNTLFDLVVAVQLLSAVVLLRASLHTWNHATASDLPPEALTDKVLPSLSVLIPARDETADLERCLERLVASDYPKLEIVVLDDCSVNRRTSEIIRSFAHAGVRFVQGEVPDETRWLAKNYAYQRLYEEASSDLLLFLGVDVELEPQSLRRLVGELQARNKDMLSVMPLQAASAGTGSSLLRATRYYWEICLPRRFFKRPPVLSACWMIRRSALERMGGFASVSRSVSPEAPLARQAVVTDAYSFIRSDETLGVYGSKIVTTQYTTSVRVRYPQLHRRLELVALISFFELFCLLGPLIGLFLSPRLHHSAAYAAIWVVCLLCLFSTYTLVAVGARLTSRYGGWLLMPAAFAVDLFLLHVSLWKYEFSVVDWRGRNVCIPVMQYTPQISQRSVPVPVKS
jgi:glycosyltransferase involved in cell wall biosynthesis